MTRVALLVQKTTAIEDGNYLRFARALHHRQYQVDVCSIDSLRMIDSKIVADGFSWQPSLEVDSLFPEQTTQVIEHDIVWILSLGDRGGFLDKYQLLYARSEEHTSELQSRRKLVCRLLLVKNK